MNKEKQEHHKEEENVLTIGEITLGSSKTTIRELKEVAIELLKDNTIKEYLGLLSKKNMSHNGMSYAG